MNTVIRTVTDAAHYVDSSALQISDALSKFITHIDAFFSHLYTCSEERLTLSEKAAANMASMSQELQRVVEQTQTQARETEENSLALQALQLTIQKITDKTNRESTINEALYQLVATGKERIAAALSGVKEIENSSQSINNTIQAINEIAEKTQILAMNAKIQAAHAGQAGKGFAVVATEMSTLSETTKNKASTIITYIDGIFQRISHSLHQIDDAFQSFTAIQEQVDQSKTIAFEVADHMNRENTYLAKISQSINALAESSSSIKDLALTLQQGGEEVKEAFAHLKEEAYQENQRRAENSRYVEETTDTVSHLLRDNTHIAADLNKLIKGFVIGEEDL
jgi:methyl-accepting chemotaxis protein